MMMNRKLIAAAMLMLSLSPAWAGNDAHTGHQPSAPATASEDMGMEMDHGAMADAAPSEPRDPHAYSGGYDFSQFPMRHAMGELKLGSLRVDRLESVSSRHNAFTRYDLQAWYGGAFDRAVLKAEGDYDNSKLEEASTELLWSHAVAPYWDRQLGLRYDSGIEPDRTWLALGIQGLAPYWFEVGVTGYLGEEGRTALNLEAEYELLLTQKLILQPSIEASFYGKDDPERDIGSGLSEVAAGLRLRYEVSREIAPYVGIEWAGKFGGTADYAREEGLDTKETRFVAGLRFWF